MKKKLFFRAFYMTSVILFCVSLGVWGISKAYQGIRRVGYGEYTKALTSDGETIKILDFEFEINL